MDIKKEWKDELKSLTLNNYKWIKERKGLIILFYGDKKLVKEYGNILYLNMEPNNCKLIYREYQSKMFWIKHSPNFGEINIILNGWLGDINKKGCNIKKSEFKEVNRLELVLNGGGIQLIKICLTKKENISEKKLNEKNSRWFQWDFIECGDNKRGNLYKIIRVINNRLRNITGQSTHFLDDNSIDDSQKVEKIIEYVPFKTSRGFNDSEDTIDKVKQTYSRDIDNMIKSLYKRKEKLVVIFEGMDGSGKGGAIKKVLKKMDPRYYDLYRIREPQFKEKSAHFLKRFMGKIYSDKTLIVLDRSWYGRVLVERVEKLDSEENIQSAFNVIYNFEKELEKSGIHVMKFWLNVSPEEQLNRFKKRVIKENKRWKIGERDWKNRLKRNSYNEYSKDMFIRTSFKFSPWIIIEGDNKKKARTNVMREIMEFIEQLNTP
ncbi:polyphosphate kinase 2 family protein [Oceanirhabdus seepicola]|uniref:Polyphosphate kinase-2-related domain-containing protein n=1 Tax=Oceanirhabdus seepicola TaxID=2828781 RepID=A0A9J6P4K7_9CLOT|nr:hypothetical protein [Oceanirhabdus seepicola]MCM1990560.1 hypothetical protein [Oceanirhabdus seepicola]